MNKEPEVVHHVATEPYLRETATENFTMLAEAAKADPGEWYAIDLSSPRSVADAKAGKPKMFAPAGSFDALQRKIGKYEWTFYVKYLGEAGQ